MKKKEESNKSSSKPKRENQIQKHALSINQIRQNKINDIISKYNIGTKLECKSALDFLKKNEDVIIEMVENGATIIELCNIFKIASNTLYTFFSLDYVSPRARQARINSAEFYENKARECLESINTEDTKADITKKRELASHYRWLAKTKNPKEYNENRQNNDTLETLQKILAPKIILSTEK